jgi:hypothetical protein
LLLITANRTVRNRYERPSNSDLVYQLGRLFVEQENTGQHRGSGPVFGVKLKWTSAGLQNQRLQVRGLALRPFLVSRVRSSRFICSLVWRIWRRDLRRTEVHERYRENSWRSQALAGLPRKQNGISERGAQPDGVAEREQ